ncbi:venom serine carboxypeptidase-like [Halyomorpha halys]|uniref:venom serine carboxypeptidase-like n=1 Tax=Halyomorpha halys TaxID=286706 RepID=UPI0006D4E10C|nr:venom serine carboxypeptidase-like [Halyomorpha halys]KAE8573152.1 Putative retinoid-inducible serine carboxypeptidase [Halyomorpha halys]
MNFVSGENIYKMKYLVLICVYYCVNFTSGFGMKYRNFPYITGDNVGEPLFLTPFIENGSIAEGQSAASVKPVKANVKSYAGFFTVNKQYNSNMFFWYFPAENNSTTAPVVLWLQGGPGASSLYGLFNENGPFYVKKERGLKSRKYYWSQILNVIYIDNPVGTGFSFTDNDNGYVKNEDGVGNDLYSALTQFFKLFPELRKNDFFVAGESYAGKYVPAIAYKIHTSNEQNLPKINLKGISIGNGLSDPENMLNYGDYLYQIGLIDSSTRMAFQRKQDDIVKNIQAKNYLKAFEGFDALLNGDLTPYKSFFYNQTGFSFYFNYLHNEDDSPYGDMGEYVQKDVMRRSIHVGNLTFHTDSKVEQYLKQDVMQSVKPWIEKLVEKYKVLFYNGQLDIIVPYPLTINFLQRLKWSGANIYKTVPRKKWMVGNELAGYSKTVKGFTEVLVRNAGHMVPGDQPKWALDLITRFVYNKPF